MIYIHIPFCRQICSYCDFHHSASLARRDEIVDAIAAEIRRRRSFVPSAKTLYFGGGTPSVCTVEQIAMLVDLVGELWPCESDTNQLRVLMPNANEQVGGVSTGEQMKTGQRNNFEEVTLEANPEDLNPEYLAGLRRAGVNRLSIGIQSFFDHHLQKMNRRHTGKGAMQAVRDAQAAGFDNITIDLMYGLPWMSIDEWSANIESAIELGVQHISAYHLSIEPKTVIGKQRLAPVPDKVSELHYQMLCGRLENAGFEHYEVSNFALEGRRAVHNSRYWTGEAYLGVGPSAHSFDGSSIRHWNVSSNKLYLEGDVGEQEQLTARDRHNEYLMTRLRTKDGFELAEYKAIFGSDFSTIRGINIDDGFAKIAESDFLISDSIISSLFWEQTT